VQHAQAERWLALEYVAALALTVVYGLRKDGNLIGPQRAAVITLAYGFLSLFTLTDVTSPLGPAFGGLIILGILVRPTKNAAGQATTPGLEVATGLGSFVANASGSTSVSQGAGATTTQQGQGTSSGGGGLLGALGQALLAPGEGLSAAAQLPGVAEITQIPSLLTSSSLPGTSSHTPTGLGAILNWLGL